MTSRTNPRRAAVFGPTEITTLATAYDAALAAVTDDHDGAARLSVREIRRRVASSIMAAARQGELDPTQLKIVALDSLAAANTEAGAEHAATPR